MTEIRALLLTGVVASTRLSERLGDVAMANVWATHDRAARDLLPLHGGREIDKTDGMLLIGRLIHAGEATEGGSWPQRRAVVTDVRCWLACARAGRHAACNLRGRSPAACGNPSYRDNAWMRGQRPPRAHQPPST
jgi:hypothetical protein